MVIGKATAADLRKVATLYDLVCGCLEAGDNWPGWKLGVYPVYETAKEAFQEGTLYVAREEDGGVVGTVILRHRPEAGYARVDWGVTLPEEEVLVVYTLAVHPRRTRQGIGEALLRFCVEQARARGVKAVRLDVWERNLPAIRLYERCGFCCVGKVDLGYPPVGEDKLYQLLLSCE